ncbi:MAG TPA: Hsp20/alpha crystallin family protein [Thermoplasmata archaeon]|nr:Hsp20/alpha crystallin family protein [Thermoplasmata archaeon]
MTNEIQPTTNPSDPWTDLDRAFERTRAQFYRALGLPTFAAFGAPDGAAPALFRAPRLDVTDTGAAYRIVAEVPGIPKDQLDIRVRGTSVEIRGESAKATEEKEAEYVHRERTYAGFYRSLEMPEPVIGTDAKAKVENGILELELPKVTPTPSSDEVKVAVA